MAAEVQGARLASLESLQGVGHVGGVGVAAAANAAHAPVVLADIIEAEAARWGADLLPADRALIIETVRFLTASVIIEPDAEGREAAGVAAAFVRGMISAIDILIPQG